MARTEAVGRSIAVSRGKSEPGIIGIDAHMMDATGNWRPKIGMANRTSREWRLVGERTWVSAPRWAIGESIFRCAVGTTRVRPANPERLALTLLAVSEGRVRLSARS